MTTSPGFAARTDVGRERQQNEDRFLARPPIFAVADGLGGHEAGEVAAEIAIQHLDRAASDAEGDVLLERVLRSANTSIRDAARGHAERAGMGTTCTAIWLAGDEVQLAHVGDSRAYRLRRGRLVQLTEDHTLVAELVREGIIAESEAREDERRHVLTQALGSDRDLRVDSISLVVEPGDRYLICSDGLSGQISDSEIQAILTHDGDPGIAADELINHANAAGGVDNVTVVLFDVSPAMAGSSPVVRGHGGSRRPRSKRTVTLAGIVAVLIVALALAAIALQFPAGAEPSSAPSSIPGSVITPGKSSSPVSPSQDDIAVPGASGSPPVATAAP